MRTGVALCEKAVRAGGRGSLPQQSAGCLADPRTKCKPELGRREGPAYRGRAAGEDLGVFLGLRPILRDLAVEQQLCSMRRVGPCYAEIA